MLRVGITNEREYTVEEKHLATFLRSGNVEVLSTPAMISFMEETCRMAVEKHLPEDKTTVGFRVDVKHLKPAPLRARIKVRCKLVEVEGRKLTFQVEAFHGSVKIGEGIHVRYIVDKRRFLKKAAST